MKKHRSVAGFRGRLVRSWLQNINHKRYRADRPAGCRQAQRVASSVSGLVRPSTALAGIRETSCVRQMHKLPPLQKAARDYGMNSGFPQVPGTNAAPQCTRLPDSRESDDS